MHSLKFTVIVIAQLIYMFEAKPSNPKDIMPESCKTETYCFDNSSYPQDIIDEYIAKSPIETSSEFTQHRISDDDGIEICPAFNPTLDPIYYIVDTTGDTRYVVQSKNFTQLFRCVKCKSPGPLKRLTIPFTKQNVCQYNVTCIEDRVPVKFLVLKHNMEGMELATIKDGLPMACSCRYQYPPVRTPEECLPEEYDDDLGPEYSAV